MGILIHIFESNIRMSSCSIVISDSYLLILKIFPWKHEWYARCPRSNYLLLVAMMQYLCNTLYKDNIQLTSSSASRDYVMSICNVILWWPITDLPTLTIPPCVTRFLYISHGLTTWLSFLTILILYFISCNLLCYLYFSLILRFYSDRNDLFIILKFQDFSSFSSIVEVKLS